ncbi:MAG: ABC transporter permease subunit [Bacillota bacterium]
MLSTYPLSSLSYIVGKIGGQFTAQLIVFTLSYGISLAVGLLSSNRFSSDWLLSIYFFSITLLFFFLVIGIVVGCMVSSRWQALSISVSIWFFLIMIWPTALIALLGLVPYPWIAPLMEFALFANPAEFIRVSFVLSLDAGAVFGQAYDSLMKFLACPSGVLIKTIYFIGFMTLMLLVSMSMLEWRKRR